MPHLAQSTIAQAIYAKPEDCHFVRVVSELESLLSRRRNTALRTRWDYEDVVIFDLGATRIVLGWTADSVGDLPASLLVSVGPQPDAEPSAPDPEYEVLCSRLVERIERRYPSVAVLWRQLPMAIEAEHVDALVDCLPPLNEVLSGRPKSTAPKAAPLPAMPRQTANDVPDLPLPDAACLARVRAALYPVVEAEPQETAQMRLAAQAMNATLIVVWMPLGAAVMTYSLLKGKTIGFSARMMAVTGTLLGLSQTPIGQQVAAMAGV